MPFDLQCLSTTRTQVNQLCIVTVYAQAWYRYELLTTVYRVQWQKYSMQLHVHSVRGMCSREL